MSILISEQELPQALTAAQAVEAAYSRELAEMADDLIRGLPVLVECDKDLSPHVYVNIRQRLRAQQIQCLYIDGRPRPQDEQGMMSATGFMGVTISQLRDAVRGAAERRVVVLPHLDLLTTSQGGLTSEAREVIPLLYENPELVWLGFKDPTFPVPKVIENLFPHRFSLLGTPRDRLRHLVTQAESRKFGREFNPIALYKYVSGMNAAKLRRLLSTIQGEDYPADPRHAIRQVRQATMTGTLEIPDVNLDRDVGGYARVKDRLKAEILDVLSYKDRLTNVDEVTKLEGLIPRGMIFWGPPGTGKTLFAKAMATAIGAAITIVSGPELKSRWVGESEENLRMIFHKARQSAPSIIVFDELDSFASARGTYTGSGVEHSMVNQLLTEMDGFHRDELVFVVGTTNYVEALDPALLRPGRFEFHLHIPFPGSEDRREILNIYNKKMGLQITEEGIEYAVRRTGEPVPGAGPNSRFSGDHLNALCRALARIRLRENRTDATEIKDVERGLTEWIERPKLTSTEERVVATHEAGHAVCALFCKHARTIERISIQSEVAWALGFVKHQDPANKYVVTRNRLLDEMCVLMGGREAEALLNDDLSIGAAGDLESATGIARSLVEEFGMGADGVGVVRYMSDKGERRDQISDAQLAVIDGSIRDLLERARARAAEILSEHRDVLVTLRDLLLKHKVIDAKH
ncbi:MAG TPA: AAA family ATPase, partial [Pirellulales bacterium]